MGLLAGGGEGQQVQQPAAAGRQQDHGPQEEGAPLEHGAREHQPDCQGDSLLRAQFKIIRIQIQDFAHSYLDPNLKLANYSKFFFFFINSKNINETYKNT